MAMRPLRKLKRNRPSRQQRQQGAQKAPRKGQNPVILALIGVGLLLAWVGCSLFQIETTEAWIMQGDPPGIAHVSWAVLIQAGQLITGNLSGVAGKAIVVGWIVEIITLVFGCVLEVAAHGVGRSSQDLKGLFIAIGLGLLCFNGYTDFAYGSLPSGVSGQAFFAVLMSFIVVFGLPAGIELLIRAKDEFVK